MLTALIIGTAQSYLVALGLFLSKEKTRQIVNSVCLFISAGTILLLSYLTLADVYRDLLSDFQPLAIAVTAPLAYRFYCYITNNIPIFPRFHFFPAAFVTLTIVVGLISNDQTLRNILHSVSCVASSTLLVSMHIFFLIKNRHLFFKAAQSDRSVLNVLLIVIAGAMLASVLQITASIRIDTMLMKYAALLLVTVLAIMLVFSQRFPQLLHAIEAQQKKYAQSKLKNVNVEELKTRLAFLMRNEKIFLDLDATMGDVAARLEISRHQLSEYLNHYLGKTFNEFITEYRVAEAKRLLLHEDKMTNLEIGYRSGFKSKSNFNFAFKSLVGVTPTDFRKTVRI